MHAAKGKHFVMECGENRETIADPRCGPRWGGGKRVNWAEISPLEERVAG